MSKSPIVVAEHRERGRINESLANLELAHMRLTRSIRSIRERLGEEA